MVRRRRKRVLKLAVDNYLASALARLWAAKCLRIWAAKMPQCSDSESFSSDSSDSGHSSWTDGSESDEPNDKHQDGHSATGLPLYIISSKQTGLPGIIVRDYSNGSPVDQEFDSFMDAGRAYQSLRFKCHRAELVVGGVVKESFGCE